MPNLWKFLSIFLVFSNVNANNCTIEMPRDAPQPTPIILTRDGLFRPTSDGTTIREFDSITLLCTGRNNTVLALNKEIVPLECRNGKFLFIGRPFALKDMKCKSVPTSQQWQNGTSCAAGNGVFYEVGVSSKTTWHPIFKICFNQRDQRTVYSRNMINGYMQNVRAKRNCRPSSFKREGMSNNPDRLYQKENQRTRFEALFGANQNFISGVSFLARGHIAPVVDFIFCYEQYATFYYANVAPEWQVVNAGNWASVENAVRKIASSKQSDVLVFTGTLGVLQLRNPLTSRDTSIYLGVNQTIAVPKWFYKVVMHRSFAYDIVFITLNNPFERNAVGGEFCNNICSRFCNQQSLDCSKFTDTNKGYTFCCELKDFWANAMGVGTPYYELPNGWSYK